MIRIVENEAGGLIDRRGARAGRRVRLRAGMDGERGKSGFVLRRELASLAKV